MSEDHSDNKCDSWLVTAKSARVFRTRAIPQTRLANSRKHGSVKDK